MALSPVSSDGKVIQGFKVQRMMADSRPQPQGLDMETPRLGGEQEA
jgi:hypothetical protein